MDAVQMKAKYTLNDTGLLGDDVEYSQLVRSSSKNKFEESLSESVSNHIECLYVWSCSCVMPRLHTLNSAVSHTKIQ